MRGLTNKPVLFPLRLTKKSLVTLNSPPFGRRRMEILTTFSQPQRRYYRLLML